MPDAVEAAQEALTRPSNFAYYGDEDTFAAWGMTFSVHRDSDVLDRSNWQVVTDDLTERFPDDTRIESFSHWAVGWTERLVVRVLKSESAIGNVTVDDLTEAFMAVVEWADKLEDYPVADEEAYSKLEYDEEFEWLEQNFGDKAGDAYSFMFDSFSASRTEDLSSEQWAELEERFKEREDA